MAKRDRDKKDDKKLERMVKTNWIICGASLLAIIILTMIANNS